MQVAYSLLQVVAATIATLLVIAAGALWTGASVRTAVHVRNLGFVAAAVFAVPALVMTLAVKLKSTRVPVVRMWPACRRYMVVVFVVFIMYMAAGILAYPHAPIAERKGEFRDKMDQSYSPMQYERFKLWESSFGLIGAAMLVSLLATLPGDLGKRPPMGS